MNVGIDISPISTLSISAHKVRGVGYYIQHLKDALVKYAPQNKYMFLEDLKKIDSSTDLLHIPYFDPFFLHLPKIKKRPTILTIHDLTPIVFPKHFPVGIKGNMKWQIQKILAKQCDAIITDSNVSKYDVVRLLGVPEKKVHTIYLAADEAFMKKEVLVKQKLALLEKYALPPNFFLYVGDVTWNKNLPRLLRALKRTSIPCVIVGKALLEKNYDSHNPWNADLRESQELIEQNRRIFPLGFVPTDDLVLLYNIATCLLMPSLYEGFGLPVLEAMQSGCPVITSRCGSLPEVVGDACLFVNPDDEEDIATTIENVYENTALQKELSHKGLVQANSFSWEKTAKETNNIYESYS